MTACFLPAEHLVLLVPSAEPHADIGTVQMLQILMELGNGRDAAAFVSCCWKPWAAVLRCNGQWSLIHLLYCAAVLRCLVFDSCSGKHCDAVLRMLILLGSN
ncbi:hypothetical protein Nepgr_031335 [Nepenthes gracilis]|uniref:Uncharacterized protein n=1 Tax=Nepenthes gracilis TaxID=150966 RepID=A0AAD3TIM6_NEPGR|nr:hypothetical protein Nepgr_031335 [Nepenthes gracilis]